MVKPFWEDRSQFVRVVEQGDEERGCDARIEEREAYGRCEDR